MGIFPAGKKRKSTRQLAKETTFFFIAMKYFNLNYIQI